MDAQPSNSRAAVFEQDLPRFPGRRFSFLPDVKRKPSTAEKLVDLGKWTLLIFPLIF